MVRKVSREKDTQKQIKPQAQAQARIQGENGNQKRQGRAQEAAQKGKGEAFRLKKANRLRLQNEFEALYKNGSRISGGMLKLTFMPNARDASRLGVVIRKKEIRLSSGRNRIRRLIKEVFRSTEGHLNGAYDIVVYSFMKDATAKLKDLELELLTLYKKAGILK